MQKYKFRGKEIKTGKVVYGGIYQNGKQFMIIDVYFDENGYPNPDFIDVDPESVAQFVGYDRNGAEIYEGDLIRSHFGSFCYATFRHYAEIADGSFILDKTRI